MRPSPRGRSKKRRRLWPRRLALVLLVAAAGWIGFEAWTWPDVERLARENPPTTAFIELWRSAQRARGEDDSVRWDWVAYDRISVHLKKAVVVAEDAGFFGHRGFDVREIRAALEDAVEDREIPRGASTITQQLAKNLWLSPSRNPIRKFKEGLLTWQLERSLSKKRILELYLNVVELGPGVFGAGAASRSYFGKHPFALSPHEAAQLAAGLPRPRSWHPGSTSRSYGRYVERIERRMNRAVFPTGQL